MISLFLGRCASREISPAFLIIIIIKNDDWVTNEFMDFGTI